ncbi:LapD/MoxY N-terminal periplasmic domain-containing protein [Guyparkeria halophila]|uniref:LapD/MoxY N-terminal periplasmic domain-containing protein n=1 Tax=Guyparkeria halophila TaxID=47960 RepID=A0ABZ0YYG8_9GAMM|nr:LapD/MoxY N-terminal periplasmic domain-containing protein [Guyparkeria halophila]WQH17230.1 LapD/MoxY N-terminal periplasmic domain-containing protein [Guyparkeria halophila]
MALNRQLWIAIASVMIIAFVSSLVISFQSARGYFEEQLRLKNIDNANTLALSLSQVEKDPVLIDLMLAAQFDTGHYQRLEIIDPEGDPIASRTRDDAGLGDVPDWFAELAELRVDPGVAQIPDGWQQYGTLYVESLSGFALEALWDTTVELFYWFFAIAAVLGLIGSLVLKSLTRPLVDVVRQAEAIGSQRFVTTSEPRTLEFRRVVRAMNILTGRVRQMLGEERARLEEMRQRLQSDALTGVGNRARFDDVMTALLADDDPNCHHGIFLVRLVNLAEINRRLGHQDTDTLICEVTARIEEIARRHRDQFTDDHIARLNGSDFALVLTDLLDIEPIANQLEAGMRQLAERHSDAAPLQFALAADSFGSRDDRSAILTRLDDGLARAEHRQTTCLERARAIDQAEQLHGSDDWREILGAAIEGGDIHAVHFSTRRLDGRLIHREAMLRLDEDRNTWTAGQFLPWARRLGLLPQLDLAVVEGELERLANQDDREPIALNLSIETLLDDVARHRLIGLLALRSNLADQVSLEVAERSVIDHPVAFREFCEAAAPLGYRVGIEKAGHRLIDIDALHELGLVYIKLDRSLTTDLRDNESNRNYLRGITGMAHAVGLTVIADGVRSTEELAGLGDLGIDGASGPGLPD